MGQEQELPRLIFRQPAGGEQAAESAPPSEDLSASLDEVQAILQQDAAVERAQATSRAQAGGWGGAAAQGWGAPVQPLPSSLTPWAADQPPGIASPFEGTRPSRPTRVDARSSQVLNRLMLREQQRRQFLLIAAGIGAAVFLLTLLVGFTLWFLLREEPPPPPVVVQPEDPPAPPASLAGAEPPAAGTATLAPSAPPSEPESKGVRKPTGRAGKVSRPAQRPGRKPGTLNAPPAPRTKSEIDDLLKDL